MLAYDATCPHCGHKNIDMYLEETGGWMECEQKEHFESRVEVLFSNHIMGRIR